MRKYILSLVLLFPLFFLTSLFAKDGVANYRFRTFSPEGGFYYDGVKAIKQDKNGFVWILMDNDLYRFDGYQYKRYYTEFKEIDATSRWLFNDMDCDSSGNLYVATNNGVYEYNSVTDLFSCLLNTYISSIKVDNHDNIWVFDKEVLRKYDSKTKKWSVVGLTNYVLNKIVFCKEDVSDLIFSTNKGDIYQYNNTNDKLKLVFKLPFTSSKANIQSIRKSENKLWVLVANEGLFCIDTEKWQIDEKYDFLCAPEGENILTKTCHIDKNGKVWIGTQKGLYILDPTTGEHKHYQHSKSDPFSLPNNSIWTISEDHQRNIWIGTYSGGLSYVNLDEKVSFKTNRAREGGLNHHIVSGFVEDANNYWIATEGGGLNRMDKKTGQFTYLKNSSSKNSLASNNIKSLVIDFQDNLWISMFRGGLNSYNPRTNQFTHFERETETKNGLLYSDLRKILLETDEGLWIAYQINRLVVSFYSFKDKTFTHYRFGNPDNHYYIYDMCKDTRGNLWIVTHEKIYRMNIASREVTEVPFKEPFYLNAQTILADDANNIWIGTIGNGLIKYNTTMSDFTVYADVLKLNVSSIYSLCVDDENNIWMGTDNGLFRYNQQDNSFDLFDKNDGVQGQVYYPLSSFKSKNGNLYFGGSNGFTRINPRNISSNTFKPRVIISDFLVNNISIEPEFDNDLSEGLTNRFSNEIVLDHTQADFAFTFSSDNYLIPEKNRFRFRLRGYNDQWIEVDANNRNAYYSKVPAGNYSFEIMAANNDGLWNEVPTIIKIKRLPAPWLSWQAYILYSFIILVAVFLVMRYYNAQKRLKLQIYLDNVDKNKKEEIHQSQLRFFTNISHDFRTPLSLMLAALDKLRQDGLKEYYYKLLNNNAQRLLNLVNELMDFRTVENGKMKLHIRAIDLNKFVDKIAFDFQYYAKQRNISFSIVKDDLLPALVFADTQVLEKIIINLLHNAFKYTKNGGMVTLQIYSKPTFFTSTYKDKYLINGDSLPVNSYAIAVRDSGIGISKESISTVFERFYKVPTVNFDSHLGTGIGLALVKSLVLLHKGAISIYSERDKGTDMVVSFPLNADSYDVEDFQQEESDDIQKNDTQFFEEVETTETKINTIPSTDDILLREKKQVLVVEDNDDLRFLIVEALKTDYEIVEAADGSIAYSMLDTMEIDLIISDIMMPVMDGITLCRKVKEDVGTSHIPVMLLTAKVGVESKIEGVGVGADVYAEKPIDFELLKVTIANLLKRKEQLKEYYSKNYFADSSELSSNQEDNKFLKKFVEILDQHIDKSEMDVNSIASELSMSRSKLYSKVKNLTGKSIVEFMLNHRLRKAARMMVEEELLVRDVMEQVGIESQSYFTRVFKKEFGETPTAFMAKHKKGKSE